MDTSRYKAFIASVDTGSFTKAAQQLHYTPSAVSQLVTSLEKEVGFSLFYRSNHGVYPVKEASKLIELARNIIELESNFFAYASEINGLITGTINIGSYLSMANQLLPKLIKQFSIDYPSISFDITECDRNQLDHLLEEKSIDIALYTYHGDMAYDWYPIFDTTMMVALPHDHKYSSESIYPIEQLENENFIHYTSGNDFDINTVLKKNSIKPQATINVHESGTSLAMVEEGMGVTLITEYAMQNTNYNVRLIPILPHTKLNFGAATQKYDSLSPAVKKFLEYLIKLKN